MWFGGYFCSIVVDTKNTGFGEILPRFVMFITLLVIFFVKIFIMKITQGLSATKTKCCRLVNSSGMS
jgi:hypothetical protein